MLTRKVNRIVAVFLLSIFVSIAVSPAWADDWPIEDQRQAAVKARDLLLERKYGEGETYLKSLVNDHPESLIGYFGLMSLSQVRDLENFDYRFDGEYPRWEEKGRDMALQFAREPEKASAWDLLLSGATLCLSGFYRAHHHKWFAALRDGSLGSHTFQKSYAKDSSSADALLGTGLYDYWRSYFTRKLSFLPFVADRRPEGKAALERAVKEAQLTNVMAEIGLAFIDYQEKSFDKAIGAVDRLLGKYPDNTILRMLRGDCLLRQKKYPESVAEFEKILSIDANINKSYLYMGVALAREGKDKPRAKELLEKYLALDEKASDEWRQPAVDQLKALDKPGDKTGGSDSSDRTPDSFGSILH